MTITFKIKPFLIHITPLLLCLFMIPLECNKSYQLFPENDSFETYGICDSDEEGSSQILDFMKKKEVYLRYTLSDGVKYPYCGIGFESENSRGISIKGFNHMLIKIKGSPPRKLRLALRLYIPDFTKISDVNSYYYLMTELEVTSEFNLYKINLQDFYIPNWWFINNNLTPKELPPVDYQFFHYCEVINTEINDRNAESELTISKIYFEKDFAIYYFLIWGLVIAAYLLIIVRKKLHRSSYPSDWQTPYKHLNPGNYEDQCAKKIFDYILNHFYEQDISVHKVASATELPAYKIPGYIKKIYKMSFKAYLNHLRIEEAKHLLMSTDRRITEIAFEIGYNNTTHFNRIFKDLTGQTPKQFRQSMNS